MKPGDFANSVWPFGPQEVAVMASAVSPAAARPYGVARVCQVWDVPRSSVYAARPPKSTSAPAPPVRCYQAGHQIGSILLRAV
jgi:hypothetical protein